MLVGLAACGDDDGENAASTTTTGAEVTTTTEAAGGTAVEIAGYAFEPPALEVAVGDTVTWTNQDDFAHTTASDDELWDSGEIDPGTDFTFTFDEPGTFAYHCGIHNFMMGEVVVS